jgi:hypothetical protein
VRACLVDVVFCNAVLAAVSKLGKEYEVERARMEEERQRYGLCVLVSRTAQAFVFFAREDVLA